MALITDNVLKAFARIQYYFLTEKYSDLQIKLSDDLVQELIKNIDAMQPGAFPRESIEKVVNKLFAEDTYKNLETIDKLKEMLNSFIVDEYHDLNIDSNGLDEADRVLLDILDSVGNL